MFPQQQQSRPGGFASTSLFPQQQQQQQPFMIQQQQQQQPAPQAELPPNSWLKEIYDIVDAYKVDNSMCRFLSTIYDSRNTGGAITWPMHMEDLRKQAELNNPDPTKYISYPIVGMDGLLERKKLQDQVEAGLKNSIKTMEEKVTNMTNKITHYREVQLPHLDESIQNLQSALLKLMMKLDSVRGVNTYLTNGEHECLRRISEYLRILQFLPKRLQKISDHTENPAILEARTFEPIDKDTRTDLEKFLKAQSETISKLRKMTEENRTLLLKITDGLQEMRTTQNTRV